MLAVYISLLVPTCALYKLCVYILCFLVLQNRGHCASQGQAACPIRPSLTAKLGGIPMEAPRPRACFYLARSPHLQGPDSLASSPHSMALTWWHTAAQGWDPLGPAASVGGILSPITFAEFCNSRPKL